MSQQFDVIFIGSGPAGYIGAVRAAQLGMKVACVEEWRTPAGEGALGGTCLNVGCIPSKALLASSEEYEKVLHHIGDHGISVSGASFDLAKMMARKEAIVSKMTKGVEFLFKKNKITLPGIPVDNQIVNDNIGALSFKDVPKRLGVIGAGVIGLELGSVWRRLGSKVTVLEALPTFLGAADESIQKEAWKIFTKRQGLDIRLGVKIGKVEAGKKGVAIEYELEGKTEKLEVDKLVVSVGRVPNTDNLGAEAVGLKIDSRGFIEVDAHCRSNLPNVFAIGDVVRGPMLAHKGEEEGVMVAELIAGQKPHINYDAIPWVIYTSPEIAWVGKTEQQLKAEGVPYKLGQFPFSINGRALGQDQTDGFVKVLAHQRTDEILGVHIINSQASELVSEGVVAMEFHAAAEDIARITHAHPSLSEVIREAALAVDKRALNM